MRITKKELQKFKQIYAEETGKKLSDMEAIKDALNLLAGVEMLLVKPRVQSSPVSGIDKNGTE